MRRAKVVHSVHEWLYLHDLADTTTGVFQGARGRRGGIVIFVSQRSLPLARALACIFSYVAMPIGAAQSSVALRGDSAPKIVAYVQGGSMPAVIHPEKLTDIDYAFGRIDGNRALLDRPGVAGDLARLHALKKKNPQLAVMVSIGGWTADGFSDAALSESSRHTFARSVVALLKQYNLDGVDLDWEYPGQGVAGIKYRDADKQNFTLLLKTLRQELDASGAARVRSGKRHYLLTIAAADREYFDHVEMGKLHIYLDWINEMAYDFFNSLTPTTGHHAALNRSDFAGTTDRTGDAAVRQYLAAGVPAAKIVLGVPFYGRRFAGVTPQKNGLYQRYEQSKDFESYAELVESFIDKQGFIRYWDAGARAPYLWNGASRIFITYEDPQSLAIKRCYVRDMHLGGMMFWELSLDRNDELLDVIARGCKDQRR
jgi:chitinase